MLASDRSVFRADQQGRAAAGALDDALREEAQPFDPDAPWDDLSAEALTRLYESDEGRLSRPAAGDCARFREVAADAASMPEAEPVDRMWLEGYLSRLAQRLQDTLAQASPEPSLAALSGRLEIIEQRFGATLGRVAQRADLDGLRSIEARVLELAEQLEQARERLDRVGAVDDEVRALARKVEETGAQRASGLEKLLRDSIAEWREGEQRTAAALQNIEEAIGRLGETVDAIEASKPAPDLSVPALTGAELDRAAGATGAFPVVGRTSAASLYHSTLDAADYAPKPFVGPPSAAPDLAHPAARKGGQDDGVALSPGSPEAAGKPAGARLTPGTVRIMALRARLRQSNATGRGAAPAYMPAAGLEDPRRGAIKRASLSVLLMVGAALVAGSTYYLYQTFVVAAPAGPLGVAPAAAPAGAQSDVADPIGRQTRKKGAS